MVVDHAVLDREVVVLTQVESVGVLGEISDAGVEEEFTDSGVVGAIYTLTRSRVILAEWGIDGGSITLSDIRPVNVSPGSKQSPS